MGVVINEFLADPSGTDGWFEWIELYNDSGSAADVSDWDIYAGTSSYGLKYSIPASTSIPAHGYLVIGEESVVGADLLMDPGDRLSIGNAGSSSDALQLRNAAGTAIDTVIYGTPNSDSWLDDSGIVAVSLGPTPASAMTTARSSLSTDTNACGVDFSNQSPTMGAQNGGGGSSGSCDEGATIAINEFVSDPAGTDTDLEWIELYNPTGAAVDISGYTLSMGTSSFSTHVVVPDSTTIASHGFLVVGGSLSPADVVVSGINLGNAGTSGDGVRLEDCGGAVLDTVIYGPDNADEFVDDTGGIATSIAPVATGGSSTARIDDGADSDRSAVDFAVLAIPTPGTSNSEAPEDCGASTLGVKLNEVLYDAEASDEGFEWIELYGAGGDDVDLTGWSIQKRTSDSWSTVHTFASGTLDSGGFLVLGGVSVPEADVISESIDLPNGTDGDGIRILDCAGIPADTVVYGANNDDLVPDDSGEPATSLAPPSGEAASIQRASDGVDTDDCGHDWAVQLDPTPGETNPDVTPPECRPSTGTVTVNEVFADPDSSDAGFEWIELYNSGENDVRIDSWFISLASDGEGIGSGDIVFPGGTTIPGEGFLVVGGELVDEADVIASFSIGNGTNGDAVVLFDCGGARIDSLLYGEGAEDVPLTDDGGEVVDPYTDPGETESSARLEDGVDNDLADDWHVDRSPSPGETNASSVVVDTDPAETRGCGKNDPGGPSEGGCGQRSAPDGDVGGCSTGGERAVGAAALLAIGLIRRKKR